MCCCAKVLLHQRTAKGRALQEEIIMSIRIGILGYGNLGRGVECAVKHNPDLELVAVFTRRDPASVKILTDTAKVYHVDEAEKMKDKIDVLILCGGSATDLPVQTPKYAQWFNVVDSFDTHARIPEHFANVDKAASESNHVGIISVGWDPGMFSLNRMYANAILPDTINNLLMIQNLQAQPFMEDAYDQTIEQSYQALQKTNFYDAIYSPIILIINALTIGILILIATNPEFTIFSMSAGNAVMCMQYISKVFGPIESIGMEIQTIQSSIAGIHRIQDFFASEEKQAFQPVSNIQTANPIISIQHLHFAYDTKEVLHDYNLEIHSGEQVTIQGRTGAGKSTLFKLILGLYKPDSGTIKVFDHDPCTFSPSIRRSIYGYVEQSFHPVRGTIKEQVSLFDSDITEKQIIHAYQIVGLWDTIQSFDQQLDTEYNNDLFSQGQKQLIAIARAIVLDPPLLLLDEITADLDTSTEQQVLLAIQNAMKDRTVISISHRTSAITGKIIEIHESASNEG